MSIWYYHNEKGEKVQITGGQLKGLAKAGLITPETIVETEEGKQAPARKVKGLTFGTVPQTETVKSVEPTPFLANAPPVNQTAPQNVPVHVAGGKSSLLVTLIGIVAVSGVAFAGWKIIEATSPPVEQAKVVTHALDEEWAGEDEDEWTEDNEWFEEEELADESELAENEDTVQNQPAIRQATNEDGVRKITEQQRITAERRKIALASGAKKPSSANALSAARAGNFGAVRRFVEQGGNLYSEILGDTLLRLAAKQGHVETVEMLLYIAPNKVNLINQSSGRRYGVVTPLHDAAYNGHLEIVKILVAEGADVNALARPPMTPVLDTGYINKLPREYTPLDYANATGHTEIVKYLTPRTQSPVKPMQTIEHRVCGSCNGRGYGNIRCACNGTKQGCALPPGYRECINGWNMCPACSGRGKVPYYNGKRMYL